MKCKCGDQLTHVNMGGGDPVEYTYCKNCDEKIKEQDKLLERALTMIEINLTMQDGRGSIIVKDIKEFLNQKP